MALIVVTGYLYVTIPKGFFPEQDTGFIFAQADAREDISYYGMSKVVHKIVDIVRQDPDVSGVFAFTGATPYNPTENTARMFIQLVPHDRALTDLKPDHPALAAKSGRSRGRQILYAVGTGHQRRRAAQPYPVSIHIN